MTLPMTLDAYDRRLLDALQHDGALTNGALSDIVNLSPSQCSRRRAALEQAGLIKGYRAQLNAKKLGFGLRAFVRVDLTAHRKQDDLDFTSWLDDQPEVLNAFSVSGDADYVLEVRVRDLDTFSEFVHERLLIQPQVNRIRSDFVLKTLKDDGALDLTRSDP